MQELEEAIVELEKRNASLDDEIAQALANREPSVSAMYSRKLIAEQWCNSETIKGPTKRSVDSAGARATCAREK